MPKLSSFAPTFPVADVDATILWYESVLGFTIDPFPESPPYVFAIGCRDDVEIMFQKIDGYRKPELSRGRCGGVWNAYIRMNGVKQFHEAINTQVEIQMPLRRQPYGAWEFEVKDPNGYILVFSELTE
jgi:uncharacterized glyoxalase superfamily protein PhnB